MIPDSSTLNSQSGTWRPAASELALVEVFVDEVTEHVDLAIIESSAAHFVIIIGEPGRRATQCRGVFLLNRLQHTGVVGGVAGVLGAHGLLVLLQVLGLMKTNAKHSKYLVFF